MPKICKYQDCKLAVFSHDYCQMHQRFRTDKKWLKSLLKQHKKGNTKIKSRSDKRIKEEREYSTMNPTNKICFISGLPLDETKERHHLGGRSGNLYLDENLLVWVNSRYHSEYHTRPWSWLMQQYWYPGFMNRLKDKSEELYNKHKSREDKI
jgi:hypothetical protein